MVVWVIKDEELVFDSVDVYGVYSNRALAVRAVLTDMMARWRQTEPYYVYFTYDVRSWGYVFHIWSKTHLCDYQIARVEIGKVTVNY